MGINVEQDGEYVIPLHVGVTKRHEKECRGQSAPRSEPQLVGCTAVKSLPQASPALPPKYALNSSLSLGLDLSSL